MNELFNMGWAEIGVIMLIALIVFGPNRLPEIARSMGKFMRNFQRETSRAMSDLKEGFEPVNIGIFDEPDSVAPDSVAPDSVAKDPVGAGAVEPVADVAPTKQLATTRRKTSTPPKRRAATTRARPASPKRAVAAKKPAAKRPVAKRPARRTSGASKPRRRA